MYGPTTRKKLIRCTILNYTLWLMKFNCLSFSILWGLSFDLYFDVILLPVHWFFPFSKSLIMYFSLVLDFMCFVIMSRIFSFLLVRNCQRCQSVEEMMCLNSFFFFVFLCTCLFSNNVTDKEAKRKTTTANKQNFVWKRRESYLVRNRLSIYKTF